MNTRIRRSLRFVLCVIVSMGMIFSMTGCSKQNNVFIREESESVAPESNTAESTSAETSSVESTPESESFEETSAPKEAEPQEETESQEEVDSQEESESQEEEEPVELPKILGIITDNDRLFMVTDYYDLCKVNNVSENDYDQYNPYMAYSLAEAEKAVDSLVGSGAVTIIFSTSSYIIPEDRIASFRDRYPDVHFIAQDDSILIMTDAERDRMIYATSFGILRSDVFISLEGHSGFKDFFNQVYQIKVLYHNLGDKDCMISSENIPVPCLDENDQVICYSTTDVPSLVLYPAEFYGFSPNCFILNSSGGPDPFVIFDNKVDSPNHLIYSLMDVTELQVTDENGNKFEDYNNVPENTVCVVSWYEGTQYFEEKLIANCKVYSVSNEAAYEIEGSLTKNGYAEYDLSTVASGFYRVKNGGLIQIP